MSSDKYRQLGFPCLNIVMFCQILLFSGVVFRNLTVYLPVIVSLKAATDTTPPINDKTPEINYATPEINDTTPGIDDTISAINDTTPEINDKISAINDTIPAINETIPVINDTIPASNDTIPAINETIPASLTHNDTITASTDTYPSSDQYFPVISVNNWIVWQQRIDSTTDFNVGWSHYREGFGVYDKNYWMGLEKVHQMTSRGSCRLRFELLNDLNQWLSVEYDTFHLDSESLFYTIHLTGYSGDMISGDPMDSPASGGTWRHNGMPFSTLDSDQHFCAINYGGGWWWNSCHFICLNGPYHLVLWSVVPAFGYDDFYGATSHYHQLEASRMMIKCN